MQHDLQIWLISIFLALLIAIQLFIITFLIRLSSLLKPIPGRPGFHEITAQIMETMEGMNKASKIISQLLDQIRPTVTQAAIVSSRQLARADQVIGALLRDVERINERVHNVAEAASLPLREAHALSAGIRTATAMFFSKPGNSRKRKQC